jgi:hypothetical protein
MEQSPEKLTGPQLDKTFPALYGNRRFITPFTTACHLSRYRILQSVSLHCKGNTKFFRLCSLANRRLPTFACTPSYDRVVNFGETKLVLVGRRRRAFSKLWDKRETVNVPSLRKSFFNPRPVLLEGKYVRTFRSKELSLEAYLPNYSPSYISIL